MTTADTSSWGSIALAMFIAIAVLEIILGCLVAMLYVRRIPPIPFFQQVTEPDDGYDRAPGFSIEQTEVRRLRDAERRAREVA